MASQSDDRPKPESAAGKFVIDGYIVVPGRAERMKARILAEEMIRAQAREDAWQIRKAGRTTKPPLAPVKAALPDSVLHWPVAVSGWHEVRIEILSEERAQVTAGGEYQNLNYTELGFADRRPKMKGRAIGAWAELCHLAELDKAYVPNPEKSKEVASAFKVLNRKLASMFSIIDPKAVTSKRTVYKYTGERVDERKRVEQGKRAIPSGAQKRTAIHKYGWVPSFNLSISPNYRK